MVSYLADLDPVRGQLAGAQMALLGHSWGATLALRYALLHPDRVSHLIYVSGTGIDVPDLRVHVVPQVGGRSRTSCSAPRSGLM